MDIDEPDTLGGFEKALAEDFDALAVLFAELKQDIRTEWNKVRAGEADSRGLKKKITTDLSALVSLSMQQETKLNEHIKSRNGAAGQFALDLDAARFEIGKRLDSLRDAQEKGSVSEQPDG